MFVNRYLPYTEHENPETDHTAGTREEAPKTRKRFTVTKFEIIVL